MSHSPPPSRDDRSRGLFHEWDLDDQTPPADDSLLAPVRPLRSAPVEAVERGIDAQDAGPRRAARRAGPSSSDLFADFQLDPAAEALSQGVQSLLGPRRPLSRASGRETAGPAPRPATASAGVRSISTLRIGGQVGGFQLVSELGRGAFARVFLAEQTELGGRRVALKVSRAEGDEPLLLARLQHTHIVPIHSVHDDPETGLRLLCMPYLGGANLAQVLEAAGGPTAPAEHRRSLVDALDEVSQRFQARTGTPSAPGPALPSRGGVSEASGRRASASGTRSALDAGHAGTSVQAAALSRPGGSLSRLQSLWGRLVWRPTTDRSPVDGLAERDFDQPARQFLRNANSIQAAVWIIARLAEGLEHAHSRGLLHRDLKPSNVLIAADGTPMLLDFNLSALSGPCGSDEGEKAMLGGTLPYMSPEHLEAFHPEIAGPIEAVDERSDVYSLGLVLFEMIAGEHPFPEPPSGAPLLDAVRQMVALRRQAPSLRARNQNAPWGLDAIARKCLDPDPTRRYARARDLAEDLGRFLDDLPLRHTPEPSLRERALKWARRHPRFCNTASISAAAGVALLMLGMMVVLLGDTMQRQNARLRLPQFRSRFEECQFLLNVRSGPAEHLERGVELARQTIGQLGLTADGDLERDSWARRLVRSEEDDVRSQAAELLLLEARGRVELAERRHVGVPARTETLRQAVRTLDRAERLDPFPSSALYDDRARYHLALGANDLAASDRAAAAAIRPVTARDFHRLGTARLASNDLVGAEAALLRALELDPKDFWAHFVLGHVRLEQSRDLEAAGNFNACVALEPRFAWPYLNRGLALARTGRLDEARSSYRLALKQGPRFAEAWVGLALVELERNDLAAAEEALDRAVALGRTEPGVLAAWAEVKSRRGDDQAADHVFDRLLRQRPSDAGLLAVRGLSRIARDPAAARADLERALKLDPREARAHYGLARLDLATAPEQALTHANQALEADPDLIDALQLRAIVRARLGDLGAEADAERLCRSPSAYHYYNASCALALLVETAGEARLAPRALYWLERALEAGFPPDHAATDRDLVSLRRLPAFDQALAHARARADRRR